MQKFRITSPDGRTFDVEAPDLATHEDVLDYVRNNTPEDPNSLVNRAKRGISSLFSSDGGAADTAPKIPQAAGITPSAPEAVATPDTPSVKEVVSGIGSGLAQSARDLKDKLNTTVVKALISQGYPLAGMGIKDKYRALSNIDSANNQTISSDEVANAGPLPDMNAWRLRQGIADSERGSPIPLPQEKPQAPVAETPSFEERVLSRVSARAQDIKNEILPQPDQAKKSASTDAEIGPDFSSKPAPKLPDYTLKDAAFDVPAKLTAASIDLGRGIGQIVSNQVDKIPLANIGTIIAQEAVKSATGKSTDDWAKDASDMFRAGTSARIKASGSKPWVVDSNTFETGDNRSFFNPKAGEYLSRLSAGDAWNDPVAYLGGTLESAPSMLPGIGFAGSAARAAALATYREALEKGAAEAAAKAGADGITKEASDAVYEAAKFASQKVGNAVAKKTAFAIEGVVGAGQQNQQTYDQVIGMDDKTLMGSDFYRGLLKSGMTPDEAKHVTADHAATVSAIVAGPADAIIGMLGVGSLAGKWFGKARTVAGRVSGIPFKAIEGGITDHAQEVLQSTAEQLGQNLGVKQYANPNQDLSQDVVNQAGAGGALGFGMGTTVGAAHGVADVVLPTDGAQAAPPAQDGTDTPPPNADTSGKQDSPISPSNAPSAPPPAAAPGRAPDAANTPPVQQPAQPANQDIPAAQLLGQVEPDEPTGPITRAAQAVIPDTPAEQQGMTAPQSVSNQGAIPNESQSTNEETNAQAIANEKGQDALLTQTSPANALGSVAAPDFETTFPQPADAAQRDLVAGQHYADPSDPEAVKAHHDELVHELLSYRQVADITDEGLKSGIDPRTGNKPRTEKAAKSLADELAQDNADAKDRIDSYYGQYANIYGQPAADQLRAHVDSLYVSPAIPEHQTPVEATPAEPAAPPAADLKRYKSKAAARLAANREETPHDVIAHPTVADAWAIVPHDTATQNVGVTPDTATAPQAAEPAKAAKPAKPRAAPKPVPIPDNAVDFSDYARRKFLKTIKAAGGVTIDEARDITGEGAGRANRLMPGLFSRNGHSPDRLAEALHEQGYISDADYNDVDGGAQKVRDLIRTALNKEMVGTLAEHERLSQLQMAEQVAADQEESQEESALVDKFDMGGIEMSADDIDSWLNEGNANGRTGTQATTESQDAGGTQADSSGGATTLRNEEEGSQNAETSNSHGQAGNGAQETVSPDFALSGQTNSQIIADDAKKRKEAEAQAKRDAAPSPNEFTLTGSNRPADVGSARGQTDAFDRTAVDNQADNQAADFIKAHQESFVKIKGSSDLYVRSDDGLSMWPVRNEDQKNGVLTKPKDEVLKQVYDKFVAKQSKRNEGNDTAYHYTFGLTGMKSNGAFTGDQRTWITFSRDEAERMDRENIKPYGATRRGIFTGMESGEKLKQPAKPVTPQVNEPTPSLTKPEAKEKDADAPDAIDERIAAAEASGIALSDDDKASIRAAIEKADELRRKANRIMGRSRDPMNKGDAFPLGVGFTKVTKRSNQRIDASVRRAGEAVAVFNKAEQAEKYADAMLSGKNTEADKIHKAAKREESQRALVAKLLSGRKDEKIGPFAIEKVNKDRDGYPATYTISGAGIVKGVMDKVDVVREFFGGDKAKFRSMVDESVLESAAKNDEPRSATQVSESQAQDRESDPAQAAPQQSEIDRAKSALDAAGVTGTDRMTTIAAVNRGEITADDVVEAHAISKLEAHDKLFERIHEGDVTAAEFKAAFESILANKAGITAELTAMTKAEIFKRFPGLEYRYKNDKKADVIDAAYHSMITDFVLGGSFSHGMGKNAFIDGVRAVVARETDESLAKHAADRKQAQEERAAKRETMLSGIQNPQTLEDFGRLMRVKMQDNKGMTFGEARMTLTPEQRATFDSLAAEKTRSERANRKEVQRDQFIRAPGETVATTEIIKTKHTKHGHDLWQFAMGQRVSPEEFKSLAAQARRLGGDYSSYRGNGAIPGWQFRTEEAAKAFKALVAGDATAAKEVAQSRRDAYADDRSQTAVERLTEMADALEEKADASLNQERKANTAKRAGQAASAEASANGDKALAKTMRNIAQAIDAGKAKLLDRVRQKVQVETLQGFVRTAQGDMLRKLYPSYGEQEKHFGETPTAEAADYVTFPTYTAFRSDLASLGRTLLEVDGTKKLGQQIMKVADDVSATYLKFAKDNIDKVSTFTVNGGARAVFPSKPSAEDAITRSGYKGKAIVLPFKRSENVIILSPSEAMKRGIWQGDNDKRITLDPDLGAELVEKIGKAARRGNRISVPWVFENAYDSRKRLAGMGIETPAELRAALREFIGLREVAEAPSKVKQLERAMVGRKNDGLDFFPTPASVAEEMIEAADIREGMSVLEPSAGMGHIAERIRESGVEPDVVEIASDRRELLEAKGFNMVGSDFMDIGKASSYQKELDEMLAKRDAIRSKQMKSFHDGSATRAKTTTGNAEADRANDRIIWLREEIKKEPSVSYDRIIMNPPFSDGRAAQHVQHAYELLNPGGRLVALMDEGVFFRSDKKAQAFRDWMEQVGATDEKLPEGSFLDPSLPVNTGVNARMVVIDKPTSGDTAALSLASGENFSPLDIGLAKSTVTRISTVFAKKGWDVKLSLAATFDALPDEVKDAVAEYGQDAKVKGVVHKGVAYVVADEHGSEADLETTILHEVTGHVGVRRLYGKEITNKLNGLYVAIGGRKGLSKIAAERGLTADLSEYAKMLGESEFSDEMRTRIMLEEVLAHIAQAPKFSDRVKSVIGAIRAWLRSNGFAKLDEYGETDLLNIVSQGRAALATVETADGPAVLMVAYHGSPHDFDKFSLDHVGSGEGKFSRAVPTRQQYEQRIDELFSGGKADRVGTIVLDKSDVLSMLGMGDKPVRLAEHKVIAGRTNHGLTAEHWKKIPEWLDNPAAVFDSDTVPGRLLFVAPEQVNGNPVVMIVEPDAEVGDVRVNLLVNAYDKTSGKMPVRRWVNDGLTRYISKAKSRQLFATSGLQLPGVLQKAIGSKQKIYTDSDLVKYRAGQDSKFSRTNGLYRHTQETGISGMKLLDLKAHVANITRGYKNLPNIQTLQSVADAPRDIQEYVDNSGARHDVEGLYWNGDVYLFADNLASPERAEHVLMQHELAHYGLRGVFGHALNPILHGIWAKNESVRAKVAAYKKEFGDMSNVLATEEVLVDMPDSELVKLNGWQKFSMFVRDWLHKHGFTKMAGAIDRALTKKHGEQFMSDATVAGVVRAARAYAKSGKQTKNLLTGIRFGKDGTVSDVIKAWRTISGDEYAFQNATPDSFDMTEAAREIDPGMQALEETPDLEEQRDMKLAYKWIVKMPDGAIATIYENKKGEVWLNAANLAEGISGGTKLYLLAGSYAEANGKVFIGDPAGLSDVALLRRTENMLSLALRFGRTDFMEPHEYQMNPSEKHDTVLKDIARPINWVEGDDENNLGELLRTSYANTVKLVPEIKNVTYNFDKQRFERDGQEFTESDFKGIVRRLPGILRQRGLSKIVTTRDPGGKGGAAGDFAPIGSTTLKRAAISNTVSRAARGGTGGQLLADVGRVVSRGLKDSPLEDILYSRKSATTPNTEPSRLLRSAKKGSMADDSSIMDHVLGGKFLFKATGADRLISATADKLLSVIDAHTPESVKAGLVSDYGLDENYLNRRADMASAVAAQARKHAGLVEMLAGLTRSESRVAYLWAQEKPDTVAERALFENLPQESRDTLKQLKDLIESLSQEAVRLGQLSPDAYERNSMAYLHRTYAKYELEPKGRVGNFLRARALRVRGDQYKGRGLFEDVSMAKIAQWAPEWWGVRNKDGKADDSLVGQKFLRFERRDATSEVTDALPGIEQKSLGKLREVVYWPASQETPKKFGDWVNAGEWEARATNGGDVTLWRDLTAQERARLGELDEVRYTMASTLQRMVHDVEVGRFLAWTAKTYGETTPQGEEVAAHESMGFVYGKDSWVKVPESAVTGTQGRVKKYGGLSGLWVPGPVWNDIRQVASGKYQPLGKTYANVLAFWKRAKTGWSPGVHMNNVMANFIMADWHDIRAMDLVESMKVWAKNDQPGFSDLFQRFQDSGALGGMFQANELQRDQVNKLLEELRIEHFGAEDEGSNMARALALLEMAKKPAKVYIKYAERAYQAEDEFFRLAVFLKALRYGKTDREAGQLARKAFLNYDINAPWIQAARQTALPFISFFYRALPMLLDTAKNKPWKVVKLMAFWGLVNALGFAGAGDDDEDKERKLMPDEKAGRVWGIVPKMVRMPWNDNGQPVFLDIRRWVPVGDIADSGMGAGVLPAPLTPGGPAIALLEALLFNKSLFTNKEIVKPTDSLAEETEKRLDYAFKAMLPNIPVPNPLGWALSDNPGSMQTYAWQGIENASSRRQNSIGEVRSVPAAIANTVGIKLGAYPEDNMRAQIANDTAAQSREIQNGIRKMARDYSKIENPSVRDRAAFDRQFNKQTNKLRELAQKASEKLGGSN